MAIAQYHANPDHPMRRVNTFRASRVATLVCLDSQRFRLHFRRVAEPAQHPKQGRVTQLLAAASGGNIEAFNQLFPLVYEELRGIARNRLRDERPGHTLNTTALVHEAYLKLVEQSRVNWQNRAHFFAVASRAMRRILVNYAEMKKAAKRGGGAVPVALEDAGIVFRDEQVDELLALDEALGKLSEFNARGAQVVEYRFFGGLTHEEIAEVLGISVITVRRAWTTSRSWLRRELRAALPGWERSHLLPDDESGL
jgi:RNA polymerase sigma factor (TIGR02999 family)